MRSNSLSSLYGITTFGESHGPAFGIVIEDIKPNQEFPYSQLKLLLNQRKPASSSSTSSRKESDDFEVISGVFEGKTTGMPICILFRNTDAKTSDYDYLKDIFKPGHADFAWFGKFKIYDYRGSGRASGRETISRVAASAFVERLIFPVKILFQTNQIGQYIALPNDEFIPINAKNPLCWTDYAHINELNTYLKRIKNDKDTVGGLVRVKLDNVPIGLGDPVFEKLSANLAKAIMSIATVKGVSFGDGFDYAHMKGSEANDQISELGFITNHAGGINGGISNGQPIIINIAIKPVSSHGNFQQTIDKTGNSKSIVIQGRHDSCHISRVLPVIEAMIKLTLADAISWQKLISGEKLELSDYREALDKLDEDLLMLILKRKKIVDAVKVCKAQTNNNFRDLEREKQLESIWVENSKELGLDESDIKELLNIVLKLCRNDNPVCSI